MFKQLGIALAAVLLVSGALYATDATWRYKVGGTGLTVGALVYSSSAGTLSNIDATARGAFLTSRGTGTRPAWSTSGTAPTCADTGKCTVAGTDFAGLITIGATPANAYVVTFNTAFAAAPSCIVQQQTTATNYVTKVLTATTTFTVTSAATPTASDVYSYLCVRSQ